MLFQNNEIRVKDLSFDSVWINIEKNKICLVNDHYYKYKEDNEWIEILNGKEE